MSNRTDLSNMRNTLQDLRSDLRGIEQNVIDIAAAGDIGRAIDALSAAIGHCTDALAGTPDQPVQIGSAQ